MTAVIHKNKHNAAGNSEKDVHASVNDRKKRIFVTVAVSCVISFVV